MLGEPLAAELKVKGDPPVDEGAGTHWREGQAAAVSPVEECWRLRADAAGGDAAAADGLAFLRIGGAAAATLLPSLLLAPALPPLWFMGFEPHLAALGNVASFQLVMFVEAVRKPKVIRGGVCCAIFVGAHPCHKRDDMSTLPCAPLPQFIIHSIIR